MPAAERPVRARRLFATPPPPTRTPPRPLDPSKGMKSRKHLSRCGVRGPSCTSGHSGGACVPHRPARVAASPDKAAAEKALAKAKSARKPQSDAAGGPGLGRGGLGGFPALRPPSPTSSALWSCTASSRSASRSRAAASTSSDLLKTLSFTPPKPGTSIYRLSREFRRGLIPGGSVSWRLALCL